MSKNAWALSLLVFGLVLALGAGGAIYFFREFEAERKDREEDLRAIAELRVHEIIRWRSDKLFSAHMSATGVIRFLSDRLQSGELSDSDLKLLKDRLEGWRHGKEFKNLLVVDLDGTILFALEPMAGSLESQTVQLIRASVEEGHALMGEVFRCGKCGGVHLDVAAPISTGCGAQLAMVLRIDPTGELFDLVQRWPTPSESAETLLVHREGDEVVFLNRLRHLDNPELSLRYPVGDTDLPAVQAVLGRTGFFDGYDYRGVPVLSYLTPIPGTEWFLLAKVDKAEIFEKIYQEGWLLLVIVLIAAACAVAITYAYSRSKKLRLADKLLESERGRRLASEEARVTLYSIGDGVVATDNQARVTRMNAVAEALTGWTEDEARGRPLEEVFNIINEDTRHKVESPVGRVLREGVVVGLANHTLLVARDGTERPIADSGAPIRDEANDIAGVVLVFRDVGDRRQMENELRESEAKFRVLLEESPDPIFAFTSDHKYKYVNKAFAAGVQKSVGDIIGKTIWDVFPPDEAEKRIVPLKAVMSTGEQRVIEVRVPRTDGDRYYVTTLTPIRDDSGKVHSVICSSKDITARKVAENRLKLSEEKFATAFRASPDAFILTSVPDGKVIDANPAACRIVGYELDELLGMRTMDLGLWAEPDDRDRYIDLLRQQGTVQNFETVFRTRSGGTITGLISGEIVVLPSGPCFLSVIRDITDRKRAERQQQTGQRRVAALLSLLQMRDVSEQELVLFAVERLVEITESPFAFIGRVDPSQRVMSAHLWSKQAMDTCTVDGRPVEFDVGGGGLWAQPVRTGVPFVANDFTGEVPGAKGVPSGHVPLSRFLGVPALRAGKVVLMAGLANKEEPYTDTDVAEAKIFLEGLLEIINRREAERALDESTARLRQAVEAGNVGLWSWDMESHKVLFSREWKAQIGYDEDEIENDYEQWATRIHPEDFQRVSATLEHSLANPRDGCEVEFRLRHKNGSFRWILARAEIHTNEAGVPWRMAGSHIDITDIKQAQAQLDVERNNLRVIMGSAPVPLLVFDEFEHVVMANAAAETAFGQIPSASQPMRCGDFIGCIRAGTAHGECGRSVDCSICVLNRVVRDTLQTGKATLNLEVSVDQTAETGSRRRWFVISSQRVVLDDRNRAVVIVSEVTDKKAAEEQLRASEKRMRALYEESPLGYQSLDHEGRLVDVNPCWLEMLGYSRDEVIGKWFGDFLSPQEVPLFRTRFPRFMEVGSVRNVEFSLVRKDGGMVQVSIDGRIGRGTDGRVRQTHCVLRDVTEEKALEAERQRFEAAARQQQKLESIGTLASGVAHEINNPLNVIMNYGQLLLDSPGDIEQVKDCGDNIVRESERVAIIVRNLLSFARQEKESHSPARISDVIEKTLSLTRTVLRKDQISVTVSVADGLPMVKCRSQQIQQVLMNLITNARDALNEKYGRVSANKALAISCEAFERDGVNWVRISVADTGPGIEPGVAARMFDPFFTTKARDQGTGLGLSISYGIIREHHGELRFETVPGEGTTFHIELRVNNGWTVEQQ